MLIRARKIEVKFEQSVREQAELLLQFLAPDELINWGALSYPAVLEYLRDRLREEIIESQHPSQEKQ